MSWGLSLLVGLLTAVVGLFVSGFVANLAVGWYRISSFEGGSGYFVVGMALLGGIASLAIGIGVSRFLAAAVAGGTDPSFLKALGLSLAVVLGINGLVAGGARLLADVPPTIDGEGLLILTELRWPADSTTDPRTIPGLGKLTLGSVPRFSNTQRASEEGILFTEDARQVDGRWEVPGAVRIFTGRGKRVLTAYIGDTFIAGLLTPLGGQPAPKDREWSEWMPRARAGKPPLPDGYRWRYRVIRQSEPLRTDTVGPFEIATSASYFYHTQGTERPSAYSRFRIQHRGQPVPGFETAEAVAVIAAPKPALLVHDGRAEEGTTSCHLLIGEGDSLRIEPVGSCTPPFEAKPLTTDTERLRAARALVMPRGWVDQQSFATAGLYRVGDAVLDSRDLTIRPFTLPTEPFPLQQPGIITLSPDEHSVVWAAHDGSEDRLVLGVTEYATGASYTLPVDRPRMRFNVEAELDPAWVAHHFTWQRGADGRDRLAQRASFVPLPYRGELSVGGPKDYNSYTVRPGTEALKHGMADLLVSELGGERLPDELDGYHHVVRIDGQLVKVALVESGGFVSVGMDYGSGDSALMARVAAKLDAAIATGKYDAMFAQ